MWRPPFVPESAEYVPAWEEWGVGERVAGEMSGPWRLRPALAAVQRIGPAAS